LLLESVNSYVAAKKCYFGVGGGSEDFAAYVRCCDVFNVEVVHSVTTGFDVIQLLNILWICAVWAGWIDYCKSL